MKVSEILTIGSWALFLGIGVFVFGFSFFDSVDFYINSAKTDGDVVRVVGQNDHCRRNKRSNCTEYTATVNYTTPQGKFTTPISAGSSSGHNQPICEADYQIGGESGNFIRYPQPSFCLPQHFYGSLGRPIWVSVSSIYFYCQIF